MVAISDLFVVVFTVIKVNGRVGPLRSCLVIGESCPRLLSGTLITTQ